MSFTRSGQKFMQAARKFVPGPPRYVNEARLTTVDRKGCSMIWDGSSRVEISLQDRGQSVSFPLSLRRDAAAFLTCYQDGGMCTLKSSQDPEIELRVGCDKGLLYFSMKGPECTITTGLGSGEAAIAAALLKHANKRRIERSLM